MKMVGGKLSDFVIKVIILQNSSRGNVHSWGFLMECERPCRPRVGSRCGIKINVKFY